MANRKPFTVTGKSIQQLTRLRVKTVQRMTEKELRAVVTRLASAANKRVRRIEQKGITTPATRAAERSGGKFTAKGKNLNQLRNEYKRIKNFLRNETSTLKGYKKFAKRFERKLQKELKKAEKRGTIPKVSEPEEQPSAPPEDEEEESTADDAQEFFNKYDKVFRAVDRLKERFPWMTEKFSYKTMLLAEKYFSQNPAASVESAYKAISEQVTQAYEEEQAAFEYEQWSTI